MRKTATILAGAVMLMLTAGACSASRDIDNEKAREYAELLNSGEEVSAEEYTDIVEFYIESIDGVMERMEDAARAHADAIREGDPGRVEKTAEALGKASRKMATDYAGVTALGSALYTRLNVLPDSARQALVTHIAALSTRYSDYN